jgi:hypothetical protein
MKKLPGILLIIAAAIMITGAFSKIMHYPESSMIMMIAYLTAAAGFITAFITRNKTKAS